MTARLHDPEWLRERYVGERLSLSEIAVEVGCSSPTVARWMARHGIERRGRAEALRARATHGHYATNSPGVQGTPEFRSWCAMTKRCLDPTDDRYRSYGGRGVTVCAAWRAPDGFARFLADMGPRPAGKTLDRIDVHGNYEPSNCRWATATEQAANRRTSRATVEARHKALIAVNARRAGATWSEAGVASGLSAPARSIRTTLGLAYLALARGAHARDDAKLALLGAEVPNG